MSSRPSAEPWLGPPMSSMATLPAITNKSAQLSEFPYFSFTGHNKRLALSKFPLSGQELSGANRCAPVAAPPRPSPVR